jgi:hypothetical protein
MQVGAFATPSSGGWRWRIMDYAGEIVQESHSAFPTIGEAVAEGKKRLAEMNVVDRSVAPRPYRSTSHLRGH